LNLNERFDVSPGKLAGLLERISRLGIDPRLIEESFTRAAARAAKRSTRPPTASSSFIRRWA
jgi:hypothetical protein